MSAPMEEEYTQTSQVMDDDGTGAAASYSQSKTEEELEAEALAALEAEEAAEAAALPANTIIYIVGQSPKYIDLKGKKIFDDLRNALLSLDDVDMGPNMVLVDDQDNVKSWESKLYGNLPPSGLAIKTQIQIGVQHTQLQYNVLVLLNSKNTIQTIKDQLFAQSGGQVFRNLPLTWQGELVSDGMRTDLLRGITRLADPDLTQEERDTLQLVGHRKVTIMDIDVGESSTCELHEVTDNMAVKQVLEMYQKHERRAYLHNPIVSILIEGETNPETIGSQFLLPLSVPGPEAHERLEVSVYKHIPSGSIVALKTAMYEVMIKENSEVERALQSTKAVGGGASLASRRKAAAEVPGTRVHVFDWWKVKQLKDAYSAVVTDGLSANDQLFLDTMSSSSSSAPAPIYPDALNEEKTLYHYQVSSDTVLLVKREDFTAVHCYYICSDCGSDVKLKTGHRDAVRCRECGHRILFKRRIAKPCQYLCR